MAVCGDGIALHWASLTWYAPSVTTRSPAFTPTGSGHFSVVGSYGHFLFLVPFLIQLQIYKVASLFLRQCGAWKEITFSIGDESRKTSTNEPGNHFTFVIELEGDRHVERIVSGSFPEREEFAVERLQFVYLIIIRSLKLAELIVRRYG